MQNNCKSDFFFFFFLHSKAMLNPTVELPIHGKGRDAKIIHLQFLSPPKKVKFSLFRQHIFNVIRLYRNCISMIFHHLSDVLKILQC